MKQHTVQDLFKPRHTAVLFFWKRWMRWMDRLCKILNFKKLYFRLKPLWAIDHVLKQQYLIIFNKLVIKCNRKKRCCITGNESNALCALTAACSIWEQMEPVQQINLVISAHLAADVSARKRALYWLNGNKRNRVEILNAQWADQECIKKIGNLKGASADHCETIRMCSYIWTVKLISMIRLGWRHN